MNELSNHPGNVLTTVSDIKLTADGDADGVVDSYAAVITSAQDYYPFGSLQPGRNWNSGNYRFGFNGQEMDNEISGQTGTHTTAEFWEYDSRLGRRWNTDPVIKEFESPYMCFNGNPVLISDPNGDDGIETVDKENKTVTVTANFYYDKSNPKFQSQVITSDRTFTSGPLEGETYKSEISKMSTNGWEANSWNIIDDNGDSWAVNYEINFIGLDNQEAVDNMLKSDKTANALVYNDELSSAGSWNSSTRTLSIGPKRRLDGDASTTIHEIGHALGLPHINEIPGSTLYYTSFNPLYGTGNKAPFNDDGSSTYGIMSYARERRIMDFEVRMSVIKAINVAKSSELTVVKIHQRGTGYTSPPKIIE